MTKEIWLNMAVKDIKRARAFFTALGFSFNPRFGENDQMAGLMVGDKNFMIMLATEPMFKGFVQHEITDTSKSSEMLISIDAESREEVDSIAKKAVEAGGVLFGKPADVQGWMYGCGFSDLDGHRWNVLYMDMSKMPKP